MNKNLYYLFLSSCIIFSGCSDDSNKKESLAEKKEFELQLLHFSDVDGGRDILNNVVRFSALLNKFKSEHEHTLVLSSGDNWIAGPEYTMGSDSKLKNVLGVTGAGRAHTAYLNALGVQASSFGNHEFDLGTEAVTKILSPETSTDDETIIWPGASFPYLSANIDFSTDAHLSPLVTTNGDRYLTQAGKIAAFTTIDVAGEIIGVVGATTPTLANISSPGDVTLSPADSNDTEALAREIQKSVDILTAKGVNKIILLAHMQQISIERELATLLYDVDVIVAGGSNTIQADENDRLRDSDNAVDTYPLNIANPMNKPVLVVNTDGDYTYLGRLIMKFDDEGNLLTETLDPEVNGVYATDDQGLLDKGLTLSDASQKVADISKALTSALSERVGNVFGLTSVYLNGERGAVRTEETNLGNLTAQANLAYAQDYEEDVVISIKNGGGIRASIGSCYVPAGSLGASPAVCTGPKGTPGINNPGEISQLDLEIALRFNNDLTLLTVTGAELKSILEHALSATEDGATPGRFPQVAGLNFSFDPDKEPRMLDAMGDIINEGSRIQNITLADGSVLVDNGVLLQNFSEKSFRIVTLRFLAEGGDGYPFPDHESADVVNLVEEAVQTGDATFADNGTEQDALAEYLLTHYPADNDKSTPSFSADDTSSISDAIIKNLKTQSNL